MIVLLDYLQLFTEKYKILMNKPEKKLKKK